MWTRVVLLLGIIGLWQCAPKPQPPPEAPPAPDNLHLIPWQVIGDSLTLERQRLTLQNLLQAAQREGWGGAVRYCHSAAETLTFYQSASLSLQRIALRYRNPRNAPKDSLDRAAFAYFDSTHSPESIVWTTADGKVRYYRPIYLAMETCLKCHGSQEDLDGQALAEIRKRYPGDKATGFHLGDLRGLWRIEAEPSGR